MNITDVIIEKCQLCVGSTNCDDQVVSKYLPIPHFGDLEKPNLKVVTIGLNPSITEFKVGEKHRDRGLRLAMLDEDYGLKSRTDLTEANISDAKLRRLSYFQNANRDWHPYFEKLDSFVSRANSVWTYADGSAAHIDVLACVTKNSWGWLSKNKPNALKAMVSNCRHYFLESISNLPNGVILLCDGNRAWFELQNLGASEGKFECKTSKIYNDFGDCIRTGEMFLKNKSFIVCGWTMPVNYLTTIMRFKLASHVRQALN